MAGPYPLATLAPVVNAAGISAPTFPDILASRKADYQGIYGADIYLEADSQDGQIVAIEAAAINDTNAAIIAVYNAFSPATAQGAGLSSAVKINGLRRLIASNSTADVTIIGQAGTIISSGLIGDDLGHQWALPATVTVPIGGSIVVTATAVELGNIAALANTITRIVTPTRGWQSVNNAGAATPGAPIEPDATLRQRQSVSTSLPALSVIGGIIGAVANLSGVERYKGYENPTGSTDGDGIPAHSISLVVQGGDAVQIATAIAEKKTPGTGTHGTTSEVIIDPAGVPNTINFYRPTVLRLLVEVDITALSGYVSTTGDALIASVVAYVATLDIGTDVYVSKLAAAADLYNGPLSLTYNLTAVRVAVSPSSPGTSDIVVAFNELASLATADVTLAVT